ncbi:MAG: hypothetical protein HZB57_05830 [Gammaproteobacteria bacterium]|nr:hypothetical protein [Gammaproteobacteria bacterium]
MKIGDKASRNARWRMKVDRPPELQNVEPKQERSELPPAQMRHIDKRNNSYAFNPETVGADDLSYIQQCLDRQWRSRETTNGIDDEDIAAAITLVIYKSIYEKRLDEFRLVRVPGEPTNGLAYCTSDNTFLIRNPKPERKTSLPCEIENQLIKTKNHCQIVFASRWAVYFNGWALRKLTEAKSCEIYPFSGDIKELLEAMTQVIQHFGHGVDRRYTLPKFRNIIPDFALGRLGLDPLNVALLTGTDSYFSDKAGFYFCIHQQVIQDTHVAIVNHLEGISVETDRVADNKIVCGDAWVGHGRCVTPDNLRSYVDRIKRGLSKKTGRGYLASIIAHHNWLTLYVSEIFRFVTSARDVENPYCDILVSASGDLCATINDKNKEDYPYGRSIPVGSVASSLWHYYLEHLKTLPVRLRAWERKFGNAVLEHIQTPSNPPFFYLMQNKILPSISQSKRNIVFGDVHITEMPGLIRHYLRSMLSRHGVHWALIEAYMGHCISGRYTHSDFAEGMQADIINCVCPVIDTLLEDLGWCDL